MKLVSYNPTHETTAQARLGVFEFIAVSTTAGEGTRRARLVGEIGAARSRETSGRAGLTLLEPGDIGWHSKRFSYLSPAWRSTVRNDRRPSPVWAL